MSKKSVHIFIEVGVLLFLIIIIFIVDKNNFKNKEINNTVKQTQDVTSLEQSSVGLPVRLKISKINVNSSVGYVGVTSSGAMDVPKGPDTVAWFELGVRPGEIGSAVISGHYGWKNNIPAVFDNLSKLKKGDLITTEDEKGIVTNFVVQELKAYGENDNATNVFGSSDGLAHLNLITCEGIWDAKKKSYSGRLVVFANKQIL